MAFSDWWIPVRYTMASAYQTVTLNAATMAVTIHAVAGDIRLASEAAPTHYLTIAQDTYYTLETERLRSGVFYIYGVAPAVAEVVELYGTL